MDNSTYKMKILAIRIKSQEARITRDNKNEKKMFPGIALYPYTAHTPQEVPEGYAKQENGERTRVQRVPHVSY